jgi:hypothetical protein
MARSSRSIGSLTGAVADGEESKERRTFVKEGINEEGSH